ncbi:MAG: cation:proton antiporter regulatory subunit [Gemmatimonadota bacterium]
MEIREIELPGVGMKYALRTEEGGCLTIIIHHTGHREIYFFEKGAEFPSSAKRFTDVEGRQLGAILSGAYYQPVGEASLETVLGQLTVNWYRVSEDSRFAGRTIGELEIRRHTGASVIAVIREGRPAVTNPSPEEQIEVGDTLMVIGSREQIESFRSFAG